jgi:hypothetical protein
MNGPAGERLRSALSTDAKAWLDDALAAVAADGRALARLFPAAGRKVGRALLPPRHPAGELFTWSVADAARAALLDAARPGAEEVEALYRHGDAGERRGALRWAGLLPDGHPAEDAAGDIVRQALRSHEPALVAAALGPWALRRLPADELDHAVLKCVHLGLPLAGLEGLESRAGPGLARKLAGHALEAVAAGRTVSADVWPWIDRFPPADLLDALSAERHHADPERRRAAHAALTRRN